MIKRRNNREQGQALVEFTVILPVLLIVLWGIFQFGVAFNDYIQVTSAAREAESAGRQHERPEPQRPSHVVRQEEAERNIRDHASEPEGPGHDAELPVGQGRAARHVG